MHAIALNLSLIEPIGTYAGARKTAILSVLLLYVQEVVTLQKNYLIYLYQKMRLTLFMNYYDTLG